MIILFIVIISICAFCSTKVKVNTNLADYLPKDSASTIALDEMGKEFTGDIPNAEMMVSDISMLDAARLQDKKLSAHTIRTEMHCIHLHLTRKAASAFWKI